MTPAERFAALRTLEAALKHVLADAGEATIQHGSDTGADRWRTPWGTVSVAVRDDKPSISDEAALLAWVKDNHPGEVVETVRPAFTKALLERAAIIDGMVIDTATGEALPWAGIREGAVYVTTPTGDAKAKATALWETALRDRLDAIAAVRPAALPE